MSVSADIRVRGVVIGGTTQNLSEGGVGVELPREALADGAAVSVELVLVQDGIEDPDSEPLALNATVAWAAPSDRGGQMAGLRFIDLSDAQRQRLSRFLDASSM